MKKVIIIIFLLLPNLSWSSDTITDSDSITTDDNLSKLSLLCAAVARHEFDKNKTIKYDGSIEKVVYTFDKANKEIIFEHGISHPLKEIQEDKYIFEHIFGDYRYSTHLNRYSLEITKRFYEKDQKKVRTLYSCEIVERKI
tara:strand:- start:64 stop:486 length:423 start_codon:yes stop_codon:yes gene_type:complete